MCIRDRDNTLEAMQKFVGGLIECITLSDTGSEVTLVCNDEGKLLGLPLNRPLWDGADVLAGPGFLAGCDNEGNLTCLLYTSIRLTHYFLLYVVKFQSITFSNFKFSPRYNNHDPKPLSRKTQGLFYVWR